MAQRLAFDWANKIMALYSGENEISVEIDLYSDAKEDWQTSGELNKFKFPFRVIGGDSTVGTQTVEPYFFLQEGWKIRPSEEDQILTVTGNLFVEGGGNPFVPTLGDYTVLANQLTTITRVSTEVSGEIQASLSTEEHDQLMALPKLTQIEGSSVLAKEATSQTISGEVITHPTLAEIESSTVLAKQATLNYVSGEVDTLPSLSEIEASSVLAKQAELLRAVGLMQENYYLDQTSYTTYNGVKLLTSGRLRVYSVAGSVGTDSDILATYTITAAWSNDELQTYKVVKQ